MTKETKYGVNSFRHDFPNEAACLQFIFDSQHSQKCSCGGQYRLIDGRRQFQCSKCRYQIAPTANTIFHKSSTPLTLWFHAIHVFSNAKSGISAKQMERDLEVTYKTAWRILRLIRQALKQGDDKLRGDVHVNSVERFWSHVKNSIKGTHKVISKQYLQSYLDGFVFHYNNRHNDRDRFSSLIYTLLRA